MTKVRSLALMMALTLMPALAAGTAYGQGMTLHVTKDYYLAHGDRALMQGDMKKAAGFYRRALTKNLTEAERTVAHNSLCAAEYSLGDYRAASAACSAAIKADKGYWKAYVNRGNALKALGQTEAALADYCTAHALEPKKVTGAFVGQCPA